MLEYNLSELQWCEDGKILEECRDKSLVIGVLV